MNNFTRISALARLQHGIISRQQLLKSDVSKNEIIGLVKNKFLIQIRGGIYRVSTSPNTWYQSALIAINLGGKGSLLSHESVLKLYGILNFDKDSNYLRNRPNYTRRLIHVLSNHKEFRDKRIYIHKSRIVLLNDMSNVYKQIPHVSLERAIIDCSQQLTDTELSYAVERVLQIKLATPISFEETLDALPSGPGREKKRISKLVNEISKVNSVKHVESILEKRIERIIRRCVKYQLEKQYEVDIQSNKFRLDFAVPQLKIAIEVDGYQYHAHRSAFDADRNRSSLLTIAGWKVIHITSKMSDDQIIKLFLGVQNSIDAS